MVPSAFVPVLQPFPNLDPHPLLEETPRICADDIPVRDQSGGGRPDAEVEKEEARCG